MSLYRSAVGNVRKLSSILSYGMIDYRSDKERVARSARLTKKAVKKQTKLLKKQG